MNTHIVCPIQWTSNQKSVERMFIFRVEFVICDDVD